MFTQKTPLRKGLIPVVLLFFFCNLHSSLFAQWYSQTTPNTDDMFGVHFPNASEGWAVGAGGAIWYSSDAGANWGTQVSNTIRTRDGVFFVDASNGFAVGDRAVISTATMGGANWSGAQFPNINGDFLHEVFFPTSTVGYIVGNKGRILKTEDGGGMWSYIGLAVETRFRAVHFVSNDEGWIAGSGGYIRHTIDGGSDGWPSQNNGGGIEFHGMDFVDDQKGWVVGTNGAIKYTDDGGTMWDNQTSGVSTILKSIDMVDDMNGWIVGLGGTILRTYDGGASWNPQTSDVSADFHDVHAFSDQVAVAVGTGGVVIKTVNGGGVLPVELTHFEATLTDENKVKLFWETATELNNEGFEIQWKQEDRDWQKLAFIQGKGTTAQVNRYSYLHHMPMPGTNYYRLKQMDFDGDFSYSPVRNVDVKTSTLSMQVYPNPVHDGFLQLRMSGIEAAVVQYELYNTSGQLVRRGTLSDTAEQESIDVHGLENGVYYLTCKFEGDTYVKRVVMD